MVVGGSTAGQSLDLSKADGLLITAERIVFGEKKHAMAFFALTHGHAWAVPKGLGHLGLFVLVMATGTQRTAQLIFVSGQSLKHDSGDAWITAEKGAGALGIGFGKTTDNLQTVIGSTRACGAAGVRGNRSVGSRHGKQEQGQGWS
jgi:hypothetical protein